MLLYECLWINQNTANKTYQSSSVHQESSFISANVGKRIILRCCYEGHMIAMFYWYKQTLGQKPKIISTFYKYDKNVTFYGEHQNNPCFTLDTEIGNNHLIISDLHISDSATYFCASSFSIIFEFAEGVTVIVWFPFQGAKMISDSVVQQPESQSVQSGDSVTLSCSVHSGQCPAEHISVMWLKNSDHSAPEMIYSPGNENTCQTVSGVASCVNNLLIRNFSDDGAGIYHCVVTSCGQILFGNGTKLISDYGMEFRAVPNTIFLVLIIFLSLAFLLCFMCWTKCCDCTGN
uniref:Ig-like domain-containing protein n=1 Tax=Amphiprion percula TaxID=161767 RepID=A0A3P8TKA4_AMPPE